MAKANNGKDRPYKKRPNNHITLAKLGWDPKMARLCRFGEKRGQKKK